MASETHFTGAKVALDQVLSTPVSARTLASPTFMLFQDIINEVSGNTGFGHGLYDYSELKCKTPEQKRTYISKITGFVGASLGTPVPPKPVADAILAGGDSKPLADFLTSLAIAAQRARGGKPAAPVPPIPTPTSRPPSGASSRGGSARTAAPSAAANSSSRPSSRATASGGRRVDAPSSSSAWSCGHCGHEHDESLPYCELCAKVRGAPRAPERGAAAEHSAVRMNGEGSEWHEASGDSSRWGPRSGASMPSSSGHRARRHPLEDQPIRPGRPVSGSYATAADREDVLDAERAAREAARRGVGSGGKPRKGGGANRRPEPAVEHWSDDDDDFIDQHLASRWQKSKAEQEERDRVNKEREARKAAEEAEAARQAAEEEAREAAQQVHERTASQADWESFARLGDGAVIRMSDVPWPMLDKTSLGLDGGAAARKRAFRAASLRWHPDKFLQAFGSRLHPGERDAILQKVTETSQAINSIFQETA